MSLLQRLLILIIALLLVAALVGLLKLDLDSTAGPSPRGGIVQQPGR